MSDIAEFQVFDGDEFYAEAWGPREKAWGEAMHYAMQCNGNPRIEEITRTIAPMGEMPPKCADGPHMDVRLDDGSWWRTSLPPGPQWVRVGPEPTEPHQQGSLEK